KQQNVTVRSIGQREAAFVLEFEVVPGAIDAQLLREAVGNSRFGSGEPIVASHPHVSFGAGPLDIAAGRPMSAVVIDAGGRAVRIGMRAAGELLNPARSVPGRADS